MQWRANVSDKQERAVPDRMCVRARRSQSWERPAGNTTSPALAFRLGADEIDGSCEATALDGRGGHERPAGKLTRLPNFEDRRYEFGKRGKAKWPPGIVAPNPLRDEMSSNFVNALLCSKSGCGHTFAEHRGGAGRRGLTYTWRLATDRAHRRFAMDRATD
jgi:hypothetical protein